MKFDELGKWGKENYDKLSVFAVLAMLLLSAAWLIMHITNESKLIKGRGESDNTHFHNANSVDVGFIEEARLHIRNPFQAPEHSRRLLTSEWRLECLNCKRPIPFDTNTCPYCHYEQPDVKSGDGDRDGDQIPDEYERAHGLNPNDPVDANEDCDKDGFSNLEEYLAGTDPFDANSSPPPIRKTKLEQIRPIPLMIVWIGTSFIGENKQLFTIRDTTTQREYYKELNEDVAGFKIVAYRKCETNVTRAGMTLVQDTSVLTVQRAARQYELKLNQVTYGDVVASLLFEPENRTIKVKIGMDIKLKIAEYKVIDISDDCVIVSDNKTGRRYRVGKDDVTVTMSSNKSESKPVTNPVETP